MFKHHNQNYHEMNINTTNKKSKNIITKNPTKRTKKRTKNTNRVIVTVGKRKANVMVNQQLLPQKVMVVVVLMITAVVIVIATNGWLVRIVSIVLVGSINDDVCAHNNV